MAFDPKSSMNAIAWFRGLSKSATLSAIAPHCELREIPSGLIASTKMHHAHLHALFSGCIAASAVALVVHQYAPTPIIMVVALLGGVFCYVGVIRQRTAQLHATNLEFQTTIVTSIGRAQQ